MFLSSKSRDSYPEKIDVRKSLLLSGLSYFFVNFICLPNSTKLTIKINTKESNEFLEALFT